MLEEYLGNDELCPWIIMFQKPLDYKIVRWQRWLFMFICIDTSVRPFLSITHGNMELLKQYFPFFFIDICIIDTALITYSMYQTLFGDYWMQQLKDNFFWKLTMISKKTRARIGKECLYLQVMYAFEGLQLIFMTIMFGVFVTEDLIELSFVFKIIRGHCPAFSPCILAIYYSSTVSIYLPFMYSRWYFFYLGIYMKIQMIMLTEKVDNMSKKGSIEQLHDVNYQKNLRREIIFIAQRHQTIMRTMAAISRKTRSMTFLLTLSVIPSGIFILLLMLQEGVPFYIKLYFLTASFFMTVSSSYPIELFDKESSSLSWAVYNLRWYSYDLKNLKIFLILHNVVVNRPIEIPFIIIKYNFEFLKKFLNMMYSLFNFYRQVEIHHQFLEK